MSWSSRGLGIVWALVGVALVVWAATLPHANPYGGSPRPLPNHLDEDVHWGKAKAIAEQGRLDGVDPFSGLDEPKFSPATMKERGFHAYFAAFELVSGAPWIPLVVWEPAVVGLFLALATWLLCERWQCAPAALLFVAAIPTTLRFLGYAYFVPIGFSLPLLVLGLHFLARWQEGGSPIPFVLVTVALWPIHPMPAGLLAACGLVMAALQVAQRRLETLLVVAAVGAAAAGAWPMYRSYFQNGFVVATLPPSIDVVMRYAAPAIFFAGVGIVALVASSRIGDRRVGIMLAIAMLGLEGVLLIRVATGRDPFVFYDRSVSSLAVLAAVAGGVGLGLIARFFVRDRELASKPALSALVLSILLLIPLAASQASWAAQATSPTYESLSHEQEAAYASIVGKYDARSTLAIVDGISDLAFSDITGYHQYLPRPPGSSISTPTLEWFFGGGSNDTAFLMDHDITLVVTQRPVTNPDLHLVAQGVYEYTPQTEAAG